MNEEKLTAIRARYDGLHPLSIVVGDLTVALRDGDGILLAVGAKSPFWQVANLAVNAREDVPALLDEVERLQAKVRELDDRLHPRYHEDVEKYYALEEEDGDA